MATPAFSAMNFGLFPTVRGFIPPDGVKMARATFAASSGGRKYAPCFSNSALTTCSMHDSATTDCSEAQMVL